MPVEGRPVLTEAQVGKSVTSVCLTDHSKKLRGERRSCLWYQAVGLLLAGVVAGPQE